MTIEEKGFILENLKAVDNPYNLSDFDWHDSRYVPDVSTKYYYDLLQCERSLMKQKRKDYID
ncbi:MAG TPA: hypothetical protein PKC96_01595 [Bacilli bacterium]|nr:hypothetical protein [Bacilli bacterium]